jgi:hypothetical protein
MTSAMTRVLCVLLADARDPLGPIAQDVASACEPVLGFAPDVVTLTLPFWNEVGAAARFEEHFLELIDNAESVLVLPALFELDARARELLATLRRLAARRGRSLAYDEPDPSHPLILQAVLSQAATHGAGTVEHCSLLWVARGDGGVEGRAQAYRAMRLIWEQLGVSSGNVAFLQSARPTLQEWIADAGQLDRDWLLVPQWLTAGPCQRAAEQLLSESTARLKARIRWVPPLGAHPNVAAWFGQRLLSFYRDAQRRTARLPSLHKAAASSAVLHGPDLQLPASEHADPRVRYGAATLAELGEPQQLREVVAPLVDGAACCFVKVTWHGYAPGSYTDPIALDALLSALPCRAIVVESHTAGRNRGSVPFDWETSATTHRHWIRSEELEYLKRTGLQDVLDRHGARYLNVTEAWWGGECAPPTLVLERLKRAGVSLAHPELTGYVPQIFLEHAGAPFISFARFKGPTRASLTNLFGLIPDPLRSAWHGPNLTYLARVCCDLAKLYGTLFDCIGLVESLHVALRWDREGLYRSRFGNYDLLHAPLVVCSSRGFTDADVLAARLQGQPVRRSAFFEVVQAELGFSDAAADLPISPALTRRFA